MSVIRRRHNKNFTVIGNEVFSDESLELDALGLLCYLRSRPHDWNIQTEHLRRRFGCGPEKMQRLMNILIETGWVLRQEAPRKPGGRYGGLEYVVLDEPERGLDPGENDAGTSRSRESEKPLPVRESDQPSPGQPESVERESVRPESENPTPYQELESTKGFSPLNPPVAGGTCPDEERISEREALAGRRPEPESARRPRTRSGYRGPALPVATMDAEAAARFERLLAAYHPSGRHNVDRRAVGASFLQLTPAEQEAVIREAVGYAASCTQTRSQARRLDRWLGDGVRQGRWRTGELPLSSVVTPAPTRVFVREESPGWEAWAAHYRRLGRVPTAATWSDANRAMGWYFPSALPPGATAAEVA